MSVSCNLEGIPQLLNRFAELAINSNAAQNNGLHVAAEKLTNEVRSTKKFDDRSGDLRESIKQSTVKKNKYGKYIWVGDVDGKVDYSWFVEFGRNGKTGYIAPTHFLKGTMLENSNELQTMMITELKKGLNV